MKVDKGFSKRLDGRTYKAMFKAAARNPKKPELTFDIEADLSDKARVSSNNGRESSNTDVHLLKTERNTDDEVGVKTQLHLESIDCTESQQNMGIESQLEICAICMNGGTLLSCNGQGCRRNFHLSCIDPPLTYVPPGVWYCSWCNERKIKFGLHSVSEGIESIWDTREAISEDKDLQNQIQYFVKYKGLAHVHNRWVPETQLVSEAPTLLARYKRNLKTIKRNKEWIVPHRLLDRRLILFPQHDSSNGSDCHYEWLVKWKGLSYNHATWELENASLLGISEAMKPMNLYESRLNKFEGSHPPKIVKERENMFTELSELPLHGPPDIHIGLQVYYTMTCRSPTNIWNIKRFLNLDEELSGLSDSLIIQPVRDLPPQLSIKTSMVRHMDNNLVQSSSVTSEVREHGCKDPLQMELEIIRKNNEQSIKTYEDTKLRLISDCDKEIAEIRKKYDGLLQEAEMNLMRHRKEHETRYANIYMNELLAKVLRQKNDSGNPALSLGLQKEATVSYFLDKVAELCVQPELTVTTSGVNHSLASVTTAHPVIPNIEQSLASLPMAGPQSATPEFQQAALLMGLHSGQFRASLPITTLGQVRMTLPMQDINHSSSVQRTAGNTPQFDQLRECQITTDPLATLAMQSVSHRSALSANSLRPLNVTTIQCRSNLSAANSFCTPVRAPAPHLRHSRPSHLSASSFPTFTNLQPSAHLPINSQSTLPHPACQSGSGNRGVHPTRGSISTTQLPVGVNNFSAPEMSDQILPRQSFVSPFLGNNLERFLN